MNIKINRGLGCGFFMAGVLLTACKDIVPNEQSRPEISGVYIGMSEADLILHLGEPDSIVIPFKGYADFEYNGLSVFLKPLGEMDNPKMVDGIHASSPEHCYKVIVCPGAKLDRVREVLGDVVLDPPTSDKPARLQYILQELETCWIWIYTENRKTASVVRLACQP